MRYKNSVYHGLLQHIPWGSFDQLVDENRGNKGARTLTMRDQFSALLYGQLAGASSLREIEGGLLSHRTRLCKIPDTAQAPFRDDMKNDVFDPILCTAL